MNLLINQKQGIRWLIGILLASTIILLGFLVININSNESPNSPQPVDTRISIAESYNTIEELKGSAELIVEAEVKSTKAVSAQGVPFTLSKALVVKSYKGDIQKGEYINILETGGAIDGQEYLIDENKVFQPGDKTIVFLDKYEGPVTDDAFVILGVYQGKFLLKDDGSLIPSRNVPKALEEISHINDLKLEN